MTGAGEGRCSKQEQRDLLSEPDPAPLRQHHLDVVFYGRVQKGRGPIGHL